MFRDPTQLATCVAVGGCGSLYGSYSPMPLYDFVEAPGNGFTVPIGAELTGGQTSTTSALYDPEPLLWRPGVHNIIDFGGLKAFLRANDVPQIPVNPIGRTTVHSYWTIPRVGLNLQGGQPIEGVNMQPGKCGLNLIFFKLDPFVGNPIGNAFFRIELASFGDNPIGTPRGGEVRAQINYGPLQILWQSTDIVPLQSEFIIDVEYVSFRNVGAISFARLVGQLSWNGIVRSFDFEHGVAAYRAEDWTVCGLRSISYVEASLLQKPNDTPFILTDATIDTF